MEEKQLKYYKMHHDLEEQIHRGELRAGDRVPSENQLAAAYQVSRQTVRKALAILEQEGYIYAMHGKGTFVSERLRPGHKSHNIAVVTTYLSDYIFPRVIQGIDDVLTAEGYEYSAEKIPQFQKPGSQMSRRAVAEGHRRSHHRTQ